MELANLCLQALGKSIKIEIDYEKKIEMQDSYA